MILLYQKIISILIFGALGVFFTSCDAKSKKNNSNLSSIETQVIDKASIAIKNRFELGNSEKISVQNFNCPDLISLLEENQQYLRCNRLYLECFLRGKIKDLDNNFTVKIEDKNYQVKFLQKFEQNLHTKIISNSIIEGKNIPSYGVMVLAQVPELSKDIYPIILKNTCDMTYLPQKVYELTSFKSKEKIYFDNFYKDYFVDKYLVRNKDIMEWKEVDSSTSNIKYNTEVSQYHMPAVNLTRIQQEKYCHFRGKRLLESHILDAASILPSSSKTDQRPLRMSDYPWETKGSIIEKLEQGRALNYVSKENCELIYSRECQSEFNYNGQSDSSPTWSGIFETLGGYLESVNNIFEPERNLKVSSKYFTIRNTDIHKLGKRAFWNGSEFSLNSFNFTLDGIDYAKDIGESQLEVGFRCMKEVANESL